MDELVEEEDEVRLRVISTVSNPGDDCLDSIDIELRRELGDRELIDLTSGVRIEVRQQTATSFSLRHGDRDRDGMGYYADPNVYLSDGDIEELEDIASRPVRVPTWLPEWTRDVEALTIVTGPTFNVQWTVEAREHDGLRGKFPDEMLTMLNIFNGSWELSTPPPLSSEWDLESPVRHYRYHPDNMDLHGQPATGPDCVPNEAYLSWDEPDQAYLFGVTLGPNPECSKGVYDVEEMVRVADSMVPLSDIHEDGVLLPEVLHDLFKPD